MPSEPEQGRALALRTVEVVGQLQQEPERAKVVVVVASQPEDLNDGRHDRKNDLLRTEPVGESFFVLIHISLN